MRKPKTLETKLRSAIRLIWSRSAERRAILKAASFHMHDNSTWIACGGSMSGSAINMPMKKRKYYWEDMVGSWALGVWCGFGLGVVFTLAIMVKYK